VDPVEHSRLLYLIEALKRAPGKSDQLLAMAAQGQPSEMYCSALKRLRTASSEQKRLLAESDQLRRELL
jgi:hypothetical protein